MTKTKKTSDTDKQRARWREQAAKRREKILFNRLHNIKPPTTQPKSKTIPKRKTQPKPKSQPKLVHEPNPSSTHYMGIIGNRDPYFGYHMMNMYNSFMAETTTWNIPYFHHTQSVPNTMINDINATNTKPYHNTKSGESTQSSTTPTPTTITPSSVDLDTADKEHDVYKTVVCHQQITNKRNEECTSLTSATQLNQAPMPVPSVYISNSSSNDDNAYDQDTDDEDATQMDSKPDPVPSSSISGNLDSAYDMDTDNEDIDDKEEGSDHKYKTEEHPVKTETIKAEEEDTTNDK